MALAAAALVAEASRAELILVADGEIAVADNDLCSLREAVENANADAQIHDDCKGGSGHDEISLPVLGEYEFSDAASFGGPNALPQITDSLTLRGNGSTLSRSSSAGVPPFRFLESTSVDLVLRNLTFENGLFDSTLPGAFLSGGGAVLSQRGSLDVRFADFVGNTIDIGRGGAILAREADVDLADTDFFGNQALVTSAGDGGGALAVVDGELDVTRCAFVGNNADGTPGNNASGGIGGAILVEGMVGTGAPFDTIATITHSTISGNTANSSGGIVLVTESGPDAEVLLVLDYVTLVRNDAPALVDGIGFRGGTNNGFVSYSNSVIHSNGSFAPDGSVVGVDCQVNVYGAFLSSFGNLLRDGGQCQADAFDDWVTDDLADDVAIDPVVDHHPLVAGSPLVDGATGSSCTPGATLDQKAKVRGNGGDSGGTSCDVGAVERYGPPPPEPIFTDGFESGDLSSWTVVVQ